jgi:hypothetical protein
MGWMQHTCQEVAELMSARRDEPLGFWRSFGLKLHLSVCGDCRQVERQLDRVGALGADLMNGSLDSADDPPPQR